MRFQLKLLFCSDYKLPTVSSAQDVWSLGCIFAYILNGGTSIFGNVTQDAAYAYHIGQAQAFFDGNKRTGISIALIFLEQNGMATIGNVPRLYDAMIAIAERRMDKAGLAALFRELFTQDG